MNNEWTTNEPCTQIGTIKTWKWHSQIIAFKLSTANESIILAETQRVLELAFWWSVQSKRLQSQRGVSQNRRTMENQPSGHRGPSVDQHRSTRRLRALRAPLNLDVFLGFGKPDVGKKTGAATCNWWPWAVYNAAAWWKNKHLHELLELLSWDHHQSRGGTEEMVIFF